jgi:hypothetical protein
MTRQFAETSVFLYVVYSTAAAIYNFDHRIRLKSHEEENAATAGRRLYERNCLSFWVLSHNDV